METMVVTSIIAILTGIAIPQWSAVALQMRTNAAANHLLADVRYARVMAERTGVPHYISVTLGSGVTYRVQRSAAPPAIAPASDPVVRSASLGANMPGVSFTANGTSADCFGSVVAAATPSQPLVFNARGLPNGTASYFVGSDDGTNTYVIAVTGAGRVRLCRRVGGGWV
jgi:Tfp pilus assembly protein FimT